MADLYAITRLSVATAAAFKDSAGSGGGGGPRRLTWELIAGAMASPRTSHLPHKRLPVEEFARVLVLGQCSKEDLVRLLKWVDADDQRAAQTALLAVIHARVCGTCNGLGTLAGGTRDCMHCDGSGVRYLGERETASRLGVTRHEYRKTHRDKHKELISRLMELYLELEHRLRGA